MGILQKLESFVQEVNTHPTHDSEQLKEDPGEGKAVAGPPCCFTLRSELTD